MSFSLTVAFVRAQMKFYAVSPALCPEAHARRDEKRTTVRFSTATLSRVNHSRTCVMQFNEGNHCHSNHIGYSRAIDDIRIISRRTNTSGISTIGAFTGIEMDVFLVLNLDD